MSYIEKTLSSCRDCGQPYTFTVEEQESFARQGYRHEPSRCLKCREIRRSRRAAATGGSFSSNGSRSDGNRRSEPRVMHPAVCSRCGKATEVPFLPRDDRPVYCRECYSQAPHRR